jgi:hypothetical protein
MALANSQNSGIWLHFAKGMYIVRVSRFMFDRIRMGVQLGLRDLVANKGDNFNKLSTIPPRMIAAPSSLIELEEKIRAYWVTEVLDSMSSLGAGWNLSLSRPENEAWFPCNETVWSFPENATSFSSFGDSEVSSAFSVYLNLVTHQLYQVHVFLQQSYDASSAVDRTRWQAQCSMRPFHFFSLLRYHL